MQREIENAVKVLKKGGVILYPTDTIWGIGCDATNNKAVDKIYKIKDRKHEQSFIVMLNDVRKISDYCNNIPPIAYDLISKYIRPLTIIYPNAKNLAKNVIAQDGSIGIRVVKNEFCEQLISAFGKPIVSTSANISGESSPASFRDVSTKIQSTVDYIVQWNQNQINDVNPSTIIRLLNNGMFNIIRE